MQVEQLKSSVELLMEKLTDHKLYSGLKTLEDVKTFTEHHVFAVWDFMSLLKALQTSLTCTQAPWTPKINTNTARFINEIVLGEETDVDSNGNYKSHFEMYLDAMEDIGANTSQIRKFIRLIEEGETVEEALKSANTTTAIRDFVGYTFEVIASGKNHMIASAFTHGREGLIPEVFIEILNKSSYLTNNEYKSMKYYLERHIELDGDEHGPLSLKMIDELCDTDQKTIEADQVAAESLRRRIALWDAIADELNK
ncbi:MAG: heme oxygenase [Crocinitomicaceae bacterium]|nr:heme oxygenase [Crocinitomicaceae bacterium]|tara:strand:+ start:299 stop:1060 length:762 start_codon:yes stop_codon:yes gene_type:complete